MSGDDRPHEIVIVRRRHDGDHDDAHGGVWKVAFADFMTAMMAFFLVLWIVNSTSKETRASVARYFNPVRLSDTTPARKGLQEPREEDFDASVKAAVEASKKGTEHAEAPPHDKADAASPNPPSKPATPSKAVAENDALAAHGTPVDTAVTDGAIGAAAIESYRDPFEPIAPTRLPTRSPTDAAPNNASATPGAPAEAAALGKRIEAIARKAAPDGAPAIEVRETPEGTLISLTDRAEFGMFAVGSAEPNDALVRLVTSLGGLLKSGGAPLVIRGHTDARRFRKAGSDNWRLSTSRAQAACDLLLRGGVEEQRIERVEGYADHKLKNAKAPDAAENRRIEILLRKGAP